MAVVVCDEVLERADAEARRLSDAFLKSPRTRDDAEAYLRGMLEIVSPLLHRIERAASEAGADFVVAAVGDVMRDEVRSSCGLVASRNDVVARIFSSLSGMGGLFEESGSGLN